MLLARGVARARDCGAQALGATRSRVVVQLMTESLVAALAGAGLGVACSWKAGHLLLTMASSRSDVALMNVNPDLRVLAFPLALTVFTALLFGMTPAMRATRLDLTRRCRWSGAAESLRPRRAFRWPV